MVGVLERQCDHNRRSAFHEQGLEEGQQQHYSPNFGNAGSTRSTSLERLRSREKAVRPMLDKHPQLT